VLGRLLGIRLLRLEADISIQNLEELILIGNRGLSAVRTSDSPGRWRASGVKLCVLKPRLDQRTDAMLRLQQGMRATRRVQGDGLLDLPRQPHQEARDDPDSAFGPATSPLLQHADG
jgi:hypothetical protein